MAFRPIDLSKPYDMATTRAASLGITIKGLFLTDYVKELAAIGIAWPTKYVAFKDYPSEEANQLIETLATKKHGKQALRQALHEISHTQYPALRASVIGKVVFGVLGDNIPAVMRIAGKGYEIASSNLGPVRVLEVTDNRAVVQLVKQTLPLEGWHTGVFSGAITSMKRRVTNLAVDLEDELNGQIEIGWQ